MHPTPEKKNSWLTWVKTHRYCLAGLYLFVFLAGFGLLEVFEPSPKYILHCVVDDWIPFHEGFLIPYCLWYFWVPGMMLYFMIRERETYLRLCFVLFTGATLCLVLYLLLPNGLDLRREITSNNLCAQAVKLLRSVDPPVNVCPSIHVSSTVAIHLCLLRSRLASENQSWKGLSLAVTVLICLSTVMIKQHSVIDVACGWILSQLLCWGSDLIWKRERRQ